MSGYTLADGVTLKNKLGATDEDVLAELEVREVRARLLEIELGAGPTGQFDAEHLRAIHRHLFQDVYEWAGHTRDERVPLPDGTVASEPILRKPEGQPFLIGPAIPAALADIAAKLREADNLRGLPREEFAERAADVMVELNAVHPFREGNGRSQRAFIQELAREAGHTLDFSIVSRERMVQASVAAHEHGDLSMMRRLFDEISDPARVALLRESIGMLEKLEFKWNDHYVATIAPGHSVNLVFAGIAGDQFMARTQSDILFGRTSELPKPHPKRDEQFTLTLPPRAYAETSHERPLSSNEILASANDPVLRQRYLKEEQRREDQIKSAAPTPVTAERAAARGKVPGEKQAEYEKFVSDHNGDKFVRDLDDDHSREREHGRPGGKGGRGGRGR